jgi:hypothetical protein
MPDGSFSTAVDYPLGAFAATALAVGDLNGDGKIDLIAMSPYPPTLFILQGNGDGTFQAASQIPLAENSQPTGLIVGDFNKDGKLDLALSGSFGGPAVAVLLGSGNGTFEPEVDYPTSGSLSVIAGDFNGDGFDDLAVGSGYSGGGGDTISILLGNGDGTFKPYVGVPIPGDGEDVMAAADLNHDGKLDLVVASFYSTTGAIAILLGNGDGSFAPAIFAGPPGFGPNAVVVGDFNGDGKPDIAATNNGDNDVSVFIGIGDGTFKYPLNYPAGINPLGLVTADFNGDGHQDIGSLSSYILSAAVTVLIGRGDGTFSSHTNHAVPIFPIDLAAGDFNGDGKPDLVTDSFNSPGSVTILLGDGSGTFINHKDTKVGNYPYLLTTGDFNGDGKLDVVLSTTNALTGMEMLSTLLGNGDGTLQLPLSQNISSVPGNLAVGDFNLDGKLDLATCLQLTTGVSVFLGKGDGTFEAPSFFDAGNTGTNVGPVFVANLNGGNKPDLVVSTASGISVLLGDGNGSFQRYRAVLPGYSLLAVGDFNSDGKADLVVSASSPFVGIALGKGDGTFAPPQSVFVPAVLTIGRAVVGDFNGDGKLDFAFISSAQTLSLLPGNGDGTFGQRIDFLTENSPWSIAGADFNGDGGLDLAVGIAALGSSGTVSIYKNHPVGALDPSSLDFGSLKLGSSKALTTTLYNSGGSPLSISAFTVTGGFTQANTCPASLAVGSSCAISITFQPTRVGSQRGTLRIKDSATTKPQMITLSGVGVK